MYALDKERNKTQRKYMRAKRDRKDRGREKKQKWTERVKTQNRGSFIHIPYTFYSLTLCNIICDNTSKAMQHATDVCDETRKNFNTIIILYTDIQ